MIPEFPGRTSVITKVLKKKKKNKRVRPEGPGQKRRRDTRGEVRGWVR